MATVHAMFAVLLQALESRAGTALMLQKQLSAEEMKTEGLAWALQQVVSVLDGAQADANAFQAANEDLLSRLHSRDAEVADLRRTMADLRSQLACPTIPEAQVLFCCHTCRP